MVFVKITTEALQPKEMVVIDPILFMLNFWGNATRFVLYGTGVRDIRHDVFSDGKFLLQRTPPELKSL